RRLRAHRRGAPHALRRGLCLHEPALGRQVAPHRGPDRPRQPARPPPHRLLRLYERTPVGPSEQRRRALTRTAAPARRGPPVTIAPSATAIYSLTATGGEP